MPEDKLTPGQRLRLEAFAQALNSHMTVRIEPDKPAANIVQLPNVALIFPTMGDVFRRAEIIEQWLKQAKD